MVAFNYDRVKYYLSKENVTFSDTVLELLGYSGYLPIHPKSYLNARRWKAEGENIKKLFDEFNQKNQEKKSDIESGAFEKPVSNEIGDVAEAKSVSG